jgi:zinc protease
MRSNFIRTAILVGLIALPFSGLNAQAPQARPWEKIPIPALHSFKPEQPKRIVLKNGIVVFLEEDHELPFVQGSIMLRGGSREEPAAKVGLVELYGETWRTSGTATLSGDAMDNQLEALAAKIETGGDLDSTSLGWDCLKGDFDKVFALSVDLLLHPKFDSDKLQLAQQQIATGIVRRNDDAGGIAAREAAKLVYGAESPYAREPELATISAITLADLDAWHKQTVQPANMLISVSGDFDSASVEAKLRAAFESLPSGRAFPAAKVEFPAPKPGLYFVDKDDVNQSNIRIVGLGTDRRNPDLYALAVMNEVFGGGFGSRLFQTIRTRLGLAYAVGGSYGAGWDHPGTFSVFAGTQSIRTVETITELKAEIEALRTQPVTAEEVARAKDQLLNGWIFEYDTRDKVLAAQVRLAFFGYPSDYLEKYREGLEKVTPADVERVAKKYVDLSKLAILVVGNQKQIQPPLSKLGDVKMLDITIPMPAGMGVQQ